jgi:hypothetical protein
MRTPLTALTVSCALAVNILRSAHAATVKKLQLQEPIAITTFSDEYLTVEDGT